MAPADIVVAGEIIEHLDSPGAFLRSVREIIKPGGDLIITTPNAYRTINFLAPLLGGELNHPDHVGLHSIHTLRTLGVRNGYDVAYLGYYQNPTRTSGYSPTVLLVRVVRWLQAICLRSKPHWSDGLYVVLRRPLKL